MASEYASGPLNSPYEIAPLNKVVFFNIGHNQFIFYFRKLKDYIEKYLIANFTRFTLIYKHHLHNCWSTVIDHHNSISDLQKASKNGHYDHLTNTEVLILVLFLLF